MLNRNEIKSRSQQFVGEWKNAVREEADAQEFEIDFLNIFGISRRRVATFEHKVKLSDETNGYIDLFWKGMIIIEMKSRGKDLEKAFQQAKKYTEGLKQNELPKAILICDFNNFHFYDLDNDAKKTEFTIDELPSHLELFDFMAGYQQRIYQEQDPVNVQAAVLMGRLHDQLKAVGYEGHPLEVYLVRLLFCLFADDTNIFAKDDFSYFLQQRTAEDGSDLAAKLTEIFFVLNTPKAQRLKNIDEQLDAFPYVNGGIFKEILPPASFDSKMRQTLLECCYLDWSKISPAIFGSMFQSVMNPLERRNLGAHYTSEENILKVIHPLFLDALWSEFNKLKTVTINRKEKINAFHDKIASLRFLDPACGCGNFLVVAYRELRLLELEVMKLLRKDNQLVMDISELCKVNVGQFYGIEIEDFPAQVAQVAMWLIDHQMNMQVSAAFGQYFVRIPISHSATILNTDSIATDWKSMLCEQPDIAFDYIMGNPPFVGARLMNGEQKAALMQIFDNSKNCGNLDFVTCWYKKAADYLQDSPKTKVAFVSTNSICQGEQVSILWKMLMQKYGVKINFAHQTFKWTNEGRGKAAVYCIIVGFAKFDDLQKRLFVYENVAGKPEEMAVKQINAYLVDAPMVFIESRTTPLCNVPEIGIGNKPIDDGNYLFTDTEKEEFLKIEPQAARYFRRWYGSDEFINNRVRWCLWLGDAEPHELSKMPLSEKRIANVKQFRLASKSAGTRKLALTPRNFHVENMPQTTYIAIPETSSERRTYIPMGFLSPNELCSNAMRLIPNTTLYHFGILTSSMHMAWMRAVCGRLEMRYRYSKDIVYNNFPWPEAKIVSSLNNGEVKNFASIEKTAQAILDIRNSYPDASLSDLYNPNFMPSALLKAHQNLDKLVEKAYGRTFENDMQRVAFLFEKHQELTKDLFTEKLGERKRRKK